MKNIVFIATSLDGYIAGANGEIDWLHLIPNPENDNMGFNALMEEVDAVIMGRKTYETVIGFEGDWPYRKHVFVLSNSLKKIPDKLDGKVSLMNGNHRDILDQIHNGGYSNLYIDGGTTIQGFLREDLIDELRITTIPILLGGGFSLFGELQGSLEFELKESKLFLNQLVQNHYRRKKANNT